MDCYIDDFSNMFEADDLDIEVSGSFYGEIDLGEAGYHEYHQCGEEAYSNGDLEVSVSINGGELDISKLIEHLIDEGKVCNLMQVIKDWFSESELLDLIAGSEGEAA